jgi:xanthine dehydrogenase YagS FAD-binding subunit
LIVSVDLPDSNFARRSHYLKVRDRASMLLLWFRLPQL